MTKSARGITLSEIYASIQGEGPYTGQPCIFLRLAGCRWRCSYCDTPHALSFEGERLSFEDLDERLASFPWKTVEVTGGEPLHQEDTPALLTHLLDRGYVTLLETSGWDPIAQIPEGIHIIMDVKTPSSGTKRPFVRENLSSLDREDAIKFVVGNREDFDWAMKTIDEFSLLSLCPVYVSPSWKILPPATLADWVLSQPRPIVLNLQVHKFIWTETRGR